MCCIVTDGGINEFIVMKFRVCGGCPRIGCCTRKYVHCFYHDWSFVAQKCVMSGLW